VAKKEKEPGRMRQLWRVYKVTAKNDPSSAWVAALGFLLTLAAGLVIGFLLGGGEPWSLTLWTITGLTSGLLVAMIIMSRRAERSAYKQIEGQAGAVSAVLNSQIRRSWRANPTPIAINAKSREAVYRMIGKPGVVLIGEGQSARVTQMLQDEARKVQKIAPGVTVHQLKVTADDSGVRIYNLLKTVYKLKKTLSRAEVTTVANRVESLGGFSMPIPKGIDPMKVRPPKRKA
jgi:cellobiose-specific phosphotransferase system component IIB